MERNDNVPEEVRRAIVSTKLLSVYSSLIEVERQVCNLVSAGGEDIWGKDGKGLEYLVSLSAQLSLLRKGHDEFCKGILGYSLAEKVEREIDERLGR